MDKMMKGEWVFRVRHQPPDRFAGHDPLHSIRLITNWGLQPSIFAVPQNISATFEPNPSEGASAIGAAAILHALLAPSHNAELNIPPPHPLLVSQFEQDKTLRPRLFLATALAPYLGVKCSSPKKQVMALAVEPVIKEGLKLGMQNHYSDGVTALFAAAEVLRGVRVSQFEGPGERARIGI